MRSRLEQAVRTGKVNMRESALLMRRYEEGLAAYTYLADDDAVFGNGEGAGPAGFQQSLFTLTPPPPADPAPLQDSPVPPS